MDIRFLESLVSVLENGTISAAARSQGLTAAAVGQRIRALEETLGVKLLVRTGQGSAPSSDCLRLLPHFERLIRDTAHLRRVLGNQTLAGTFRIGGIETALSEFVPEAVHRLASTAPGCLLQVRPGSSLQLFEMLEKDQVDLAIISAPPFAIPKTMHAELLAEQPFLLVQSAAVRPVQDANLPRLPLIVYDRTSWGGMTAWRWLAKHATGAQVLCELDALLTITEMVKKGLGYALLPDWSGVLSSDPMLCVRTPVPDVPPRRLIMMCPAHLRNEPLFQVVRRAFLGSLSATTATH